MKIKYLKMKTLSKKLKILISSIHIKGNTSIFRVPKLYVSFSLWHDTVLLLPWQWRKLDLHQHLSPLTFQNSYEAVFLKPHEEKLPVLLEMRWFVEEQDWPIHLCWESLLKDNAYDMREGGWIWGRRLWGLLWQLGGGEGRSQAINKKYF